TRTIVIMHEASATAARQGKMRFVAIKSEDQQVRLAWHRVREGLKTERLAVSNRIRDLLAEFGVVLPQRHAALQRWLNDADARSAVPTSLRPHPSSYRSDNHFSLLR